MKRSLILINFLAVLTYGSYLFSSHKGQKKKDTHIACVIYYTAYAQSPVTTHDPELPNSEPLSPTCHRLTSQQDDKCNREYVVLACVKDCLCKHFFPKKSTSLAH